MSQTGIQLEIERKKGYQTKAGIFCVAAVALPVCAGSFLLGAGCALFGAYNSQKRIDALTEMNRLTRELAPAHQIMDDPVSSIKINV